MAANHEVKPYRVQPLMATTAKWEEDSASDNPTIGAFGELLMEKTLAGTVKGKIGDGVNRYSALPYAFFGGGGGGTPTLKVVTDFTVLGVGANMTPFEMFVGDWFPGGTDTGGRYSGRDMSLFYFGVLKIGLFQYLGGPTPKNRLVIYDDIYGKYVNLFAPELNVADTEIDVNLPLEDGDIPVCDGTRILKVSSTMSLNSEHTGGGFLSRNGTTVMAGAFTIGTEGYLGVRKNLITQLDLIRTKNPTAAVRNFFLPYYVVGDRELAVLGDGVAPVVTINGGSSGYTATANVGSDDRKGVIAVVTGAGGLVVSGYLFRITFNTPFTGSTSVVIANITPHNVAAANLGVPYMVNSGPLFVDIALSQTVYGAFNPSTIYWFGYSINT